MYIYTYTHKYVAPIYTNKTHFRGTVPALTVIANLFLTRGVDREDANYKGPIIFGACQDRLILPLFNFDVRPYPPPVRQQFNDEGQKKNKKVQQQQQGWRASNTLPGGHPSLPSHTSSSFCPCRGAYIYLYP